MLPIWNIHTYSMWNASSLVYQEFGESSDLSFFDELDQPPPVHILYPRPKLSEFSTSPAYRSVVSLSLGLSISLCLLPAPS